MNSQEIVSQMDDAEIRIAKKLMDAIESAKDAGSEHHAIANYDAFMAAMEKRSQLLFKGEGVSAKAEEEEEESTSSGLTIVAVIALLAIIATAFTKCSCTVGQSSAPTVIEKPAQ